MVVRLPDLMLRQDDIVRLKHMVQPSNNHVHRYRKIPIYFSYDGEKFNGRIACLSTERIGFEGPEERVKSQVVDLPRDVRKDRFIVIFILKLRGKYLDRDLQIFHPSSTNTRSDMPTLFRKFSSPTRITE